MRLFLALGCLAGLAACSPHDETSALMLDLGVLRERAMAVGQRIDQASVQVTSSQLVGEVVAPADPNTLRFELDVPSGIPLLLEAKTCILTAGVCVANYWGLTRSTPQPRSTSELVVPAYSAGELVIDIRRVDGGAIPTGFRVTLEAVSPRDPSLAQFSTAQGDHIVVPAGDYRILTTSLDDAAGGLGLVTGATLTVGQGATLSQTFLFGTCVAGIDIDNDGVDCLADCDETSALCARDCTTDRDADGTPDCRDACIDADRDGYGVDGQGLGVACLGPDCDDTTALRAPDLPEVCNGYDDDCDPGTTDEAACIAADTGPDPDGFVPDGGDVDFEFDPGDLVSEPSTDTDCGIFDADGMPMCTLD